MPWVEISQAAFTLGVSERTIRNWIKSGKLQARSVNGRREVEIPDPEDAQYSHAYADDEQEGTSIDATKRLEVALIECGRVKGTLASQERIMENLSANIAELNAKLQKSQGHVARRTLLATVVGFMGIILFLVADHFHKNDMSNTVARHETQRSAMQGVFDDREVDYKKEARDDKSKAEKDLISKYNAELSEQRNGMQKTIDSLLKKNDALQERFQLIIEERATLQAANSSMKKDMERLDEEIKKIKNQIEFQKTLLQEAERTRKETQDKYIQLLQERSGRE